MNDDEALVDAFRSSSRSPEHLAFLVHPVVERLMARAWQEGWIVGNRWAFTDADEDAVETNPYKEDK